MAADAQEVRCPRCDKLLFKALRMGGLIEVRCDRCKALVRWPAAVTEVIEQGSPVSPRSRRMKRMRERVADSKA